MRLEKDMNINLLDENTLIIMDTNVWLDIYKLPPSAIESIVLAINKHKKKFWLPNQVYLEFNRHVKKSRDEALNRYCKIKDIACELISNTKNKINQEFENLKRNNLLDAVEVQENFNVKISELLSQVKNDLVLLDESYQSDIACISKVDIILNLIEVLRDDSKTTGFSVKELIKIYEEGEIRFKYKVAPGYTDVKKENYENENDFLLRKYGDLIIWKEILKRVEQTNINLLFIQNEKKSDWWESHSANSVSKVLIQEYQEATSKLSVIEMINFEQLLSQYGKDLGLPATTIKDIVCRYRLEKGVCDYVSDNAIEVIEPFISEIYSNGDRCYNLIKDMSLFGGTVDDLEDIEIQKICFSYSGFQYNKNWDAIHLSAGTELECTGHLIEYVNKYVIHSGRITFKIKLCIDLKVSINFSDLSADPKDSFNIVDFKISDEIISELSHGRFDVDVNVEEDMFRDR